MINWLPTKERFEQCACVGIFNFFAGAAPTYISEMYFPLEQSRCTHTHQLINCGYQIRGLTEVQKLCHMLAQGCGIVYQIF